MQVLLTIEMCLPRHKSGVIQTSKRATLAASMSSAPRVRDGPLPDSLRRSCRDPVHRSSVLSALSFRRFTEIHLPMAETHCYSVAIDCTMLLLSQCMYNCVSSAKACNVTPYAIAICEVSCVQHEQERTQDRTLWDRACDGA